MTLEKSPMEQTWDRVAALGHRLAEQFLREHPWVDFIPRVNVRQEERGHSTFIVVEIDSISCALAERRRIALTQPPKSAHAGGGRSGQEVRVEMAEKGNRACRSCGNPEAHMEALFGETPEPLCGICWLAAIMLAFWRLRHWPGEPDDHPEEPMPRVVARSREASVGA